MSRNLERHILILRRKIRKEAYSTRHRCLLAIKCNIIRIQLHGNSRTTLQTNKCRNTNLDPSFFIVRNKILDHLYKQRVKPNTFASLKSQERRYANFFWLPAFNHKENFCGPLTLKNFHNNEKANIMYIIKKFRLPGMFLRLLGLCTAGPDYISLGLQKLFTVFELLRYFSNHQVIQFIYSLRHQLV